MTDTQMVDSLLEVVLPALRGVTGVLHIGAHLGQEAELYRDHGINRVTWIEANHDIILDLIKHVAAISSGSRVIEAAVGRYPHRGRLHKTSDGGASSSLKESDRHSSLWPEISVTDIDETDVTTIDLLHEKHDFREHNLWVLDIQGGEVDALVSALDSLHIADYILCEFTGELYRHGSCPSEIDRMMLDFTATAAWMSDAGFGEVFYQRIRRSGLGLLSAAKR